MAYGKSKWSVENGCVLRRIKRYRQRTGPNVPHHGGYRCMRQISGNYRAHFNQSTWQAWNTRGHPRLLRIIVGRMIISQGSRGWKPIAPFSGERVSDRSSNTAKSHICHPYPVFALYLLNFSVQLRVNLSRISSALRLSSIFPSIFTNLSAILNSSLSTRSYRFVGEKKKRIKIIGFTVIKRQLVEMVNRAAMNVECWKGRRKGEMMVFEVETVLVGSANDFVTSRLARGSFIPKIFTRIPPPSCSVTRIIATARVNESNCI